MRTVSRRLFALSLCPLLALAWRAHGGEHILHPFLAAQPKNAPDEALLAVEIPAGSFTKYEINEEGLVFVDRFQSMPVAYRPTTVRCRAPWPAMAIRWMRWC